ncbi:hypothetical protein [Actinomadura sp. NTSP31]|uniref:hypothetical protein n=1 Tax=Actinomadura sp. NTSP31 TaxID=1735447 RepID=UPI0035C1B0E8
MTESLPADFPAVGREAVGKIQKIHTPTYIKVLELIGFTWGDVNAIDKAVAVWDAQLQALQGSMTRLSEDLSRMTGPEAGEVWDGAAKDEYAAWRKDLEEKTLDKFAENIQELKSQLNSIRGNIYSIRAHVVATVIGIAAALVSAMSGGEVGIVAGVGVLLGVGGVLADLYFRVKGDLGDKGRELDQFWKKSNLDRGGQRVSSPFNIQVVGDWDNWEHKHPRMKK